MGVILITGSDIQGTWPLNSIIKTHKVTNTEIAVSYTHLLQCEWNSLFRRFSINKHLPAMKLTITFITHNLPKQFVNKNILGNIGDSPPKAQIVRSWGKKYSDSGPQQIKVSGPIRSLECLQPVQAWLHVTQILNMMLVTLGVFIIEAIVREDIWACVPIH